MTKKEEYTNTVRTKIAPDVLQDVDGYYYWAPTQINGYLDASTMRVIADYLDEKNAPMNKMVTDYFSLIK